MYSREFVLSSVSRHFWKRLDGWKVCSRLEGMKNGRFKGLKAGMLEGICCFYDDYK